MPKLLKFAQKVSLMPAALRVPRHWRGNFWFFKSACAFRANLGWFGVNLGAPNRSKFRFWMHFGSTFLLCRFLTDLGGSRTLKNINFTIVKQRFSQNGPVEKVVDF